MIGEITGYVERGTQRSVLVTIKGHEYEVPVTQGFDRRHDVPSDGIVDIIVKIEWPHD